MTTPTVIDLTPLLEPLISMAAQALLAILALWGGKLFRDRHLRDGLEKAFDWGVQYAIQSLDRADWTKVSTRNQIVAAGANYVIRAMGGTLDHFGIDRAGVEDRILARLHMFDRAPGLWEPDDSDSNVEEGAVDADEAFRRIARGQGMTVVETGPGAGVGSGALAVTHDGPVTHDGRGAS